MSWPAARSRSPTAASSARCSRRRSRPIRRRPSSACTPSRNGRSSIDDQIVVRPMMYVALSYDHRVIDGREAIGFLARVKDYIEEPDRLLLEL